MKVVGGLQLKMLRASLVNTVQYRACKQTSFPQKAANLTITKRHVPNLNCPTAPLTIKTLPKLFLRLDYITLKRATLEGAGGACQFKSFNPLTPAITTKMNHEPQNKNKMAVSKHDSGFTSLNLSMCCTVTSRNTSSTGTHAGSGYVDANPFHYC